LHVFNIFIGHSKVKMEQVLILIAKLYK